MFIIQIKICEQTFSNWNQNVYILNSFLENKMNQKKLFGVFVLSVLMVSVFAGFVSAQIGDSIESGLDSISQVIEPIASTLLGSPEGSAENLLIKIFVFLLVWILIYVASSRVPLVEENGFAKFSVSLIISLLGVRFITDASIIETLWLPSGVTAVFFATIIPFIIVFFFLEAFDSSVIRKAGWTTFLVLFGLLAVMRWEDLKIQNGPFAGQSSAWIYLIIAVISGLLLLFDRRVRSIFKMSSIRQIQNRKNRIKASDLSGEINELYDKLANAEDDKTRKAIEKEIDGKEKNLKSLFKND